MNVVFQIKRILLSSALVLSIVAPGLSSTPAFASTTMKTMGHPTIDVVTCLNQHQAPAAPTSNETRDIQDIDKERPIPSSIPYFVAFQVSYVEPQKPIDNPLLNESFRPPDIVILTSNIRI